MARAQAQRTEERKLIFLHHIDGFETGAVKTRLINENLEESCTKYEIYATIHHSENVVKVMHDRNPIEIINTAYDNYVDRIINCDYMVFNVDSPDFEIVCCDLSRVLNALENWTKEQIKAGRTSENLPRRKYLILISTPMTWALTPPSINDGGTDGDDMNDFVIEDDYRRRKAHRSYWRHKLLERDVIWLQKKCRHFVKTLVVCPGITYGGENDKLHYIFKLAFYNQEVPIALPGSQLIPIIYIGDFVEIIKGIFDNFPDSKYRYIFAVQPTLMSLKNFTYNVTKSFNGDCSKVRFVRQIELLTLDGELYPISVLEVMTLNIKFYATCLKDFEFHEMNDEFWGTLAKEFRDTRNLHPLRIVLDGPPLVGKTSHALKLAAYYQLIYINIREVIDIYITFLDEKINDSQIVVDSIECQHKVAPSDEEEVKDADAKVQAEVKYDLEDQNLLEELREKIDVWSKEVFKLKVYVASNKTFDDQTFEQISRCLIALITNKQYNDNQGYIIDGFPFTYEQANTIFFNTQRVDDVATSGVMFEDDNRLNKVSQPGLTPTHFIMFDSDDKLLCYRAMSFTETEATIRRCLRHEMLPKLDAYRERNDEPHCLANVFYDNDIIPISIRVESDTLLLDSLRHIKSEVGTPFVYPISWAQQQIQSKIANDKFLKEEAEERKRKEDLLKKLTIQREQKLIEWTKKYEEIRKHEHELREVKTLPLRQYLGKYVLPTLTEGILKIAELKPDDPVDFLAEYLFKCNPEGQQMPPFCTEEQRKRFTNAFYDDLTSDSEYAIDKDIFKTDCPLEKPYRK